MYILNEDERIDIKGYNLLKADHPSDIKRGGVCIHYKEHLPIIKRYDVCTPKECLVTEFTLDKKVLFSCLYRSPSQAQGEIEEFFNNLILLLSNANDVNTTLSLIIVDFNAKSSKWWILDKENAEGRDINSLLTVYFYSPLINKPTHETKESSACIHLIFAASPYSIRETVVEL